VEMEETRKRLEKEKEDKIEEIRREAEEAA
jgi:hypothetical protein